MPPHQAILTHPARAGRDDGSTGSVVDELIQSALRAAEARSFKIPDGEPDQDKDRRRPLSREPNWRPGA